MPHSNDLKEKTSIRRDNLGDIPNEPDMGKGAVEQDRPEQPTNMAPLSEQLDHQNQDVLNKMNDTDYPEPGQSPEHSGQIQGKNDFEQDTDIGSRPDPDGNNPEGETQDQDPGHRQKRNQGNKEDDDLAA